VLRLEFEARKNKMDRLSEETGGKAYPTPKDPAAVFSQIENDLRNIYVLGFKPPENARDGKFHKLEIKLRDAGLRVRARRGYSLPPEN